MEHLKRHMQSIHNASQSELNSLYASNTEDEKRSKKISQLIEFKQVVANDSGTDVVLPDSHNTQYQHHQQQQPNNFIDNTTPISFKVISKCMYKCQKCEHFTTKLFTLNQHVINKHSKELVNFMSHDSERITHDSGLDEKFSYMCEKNKDQEDEESEDEDDEDEVDSDEEVFSEENQSNVLKENVAQFEPQNRNFYLCSFCHFKTSKKSNLIVNKIIKNAINVIILYNFLKYILFLLNRHI